MTGFEDWRKSLEFQAFSLRMESGAARQAFAALLLFAFLLSGTTHAEEAPPSPGAAEEKPPGVLKAADKTARLLSLVRELREGRLRYQSDLQGRQRKLSEIKARKGELELRLAALRRTAEENREKEKRLEENAAGLKKSLDLRNAGIAACVSEMKSAADRIRRFVLNGFPFEVEERAKPIAEFGDGAAAADPLASANSLQRAFDYEISLGATSSAFQGRISIDSERPKTRYMRIGLAYMAFVTETGDEAGILEYAQGGLKGGPGFVWRSGFDYLTRLKLRNAVEMAEKRRPPAILTLPVNLGIVRTPATAGDPNPPGGKPDGRGGNR